MGENFKVPFSKSKRDKLAIDLISEAKIYADKANKSKTVSDFVSHYSKVIECFRCLSMMNGKVTSVAGDLTAEYYRLRGEFQKHLHDAIKRSQEDIVDDAKGIYKYNQTHVRSKILNYKYDIEKYDSLFDKDNKEFAQSNFVFLCHECKMQSLLTEALDGPKSPSFQEKDMNLLTNAVEALYNIGEISIPVLQKSLGLGYSHAARIIDDLEMAKIVSPFSGSAKRKFLMTKGAALNAVSNKNSGDGGNNMYALDISKADNMEGHQFETWCADLLKINGFYNVVVTPGSGDQGVDVIAEKEGIRYAIQCKCYSADLGNSPVQEVYAGKEMYQCQVGVVMTNRYFTPGAKELAEKTRVLLWDRDKLREMTET